MNLFRQFVVPALIFVVGVAIYVLMVVIGVAFGLSGDTSRLLAIGGLAAYTIAIVIVVLARRR